MLILNPLKKLRKDMWKSYQYCIECLPFFYYVQKFSAYNFFVVNF